MQEPTKRPIDKANDRRRQESEVRAILQDLERLEAVPPERKRRWIWELLQNAKDVAPGGGVSVSISISKDKLVFEHDGDPFTIESLSALVSRTSTKPYDVQNGSTGKFGTGFVTVHALNKVVTVSGLLENENGQRPFSLKVDRTSTKYEELRAELDKAFNRINEIYESSPEETYRLTRFEIDLSQSHQIALDSITEFENNLSFTLLVNKGQIKTVTVRNEVNNTAHTHSIISDDSPFEKIKFAHISSYAENIDGIKEGLLYYSENEIMLAVRVERNLESWKLKAFQDQARFYKEFPLIGTEQTHIPYLAQSSRFSPPETRDGLRTIKATEDTKDATADNNRKVLLDLSKASMNFYGHLASVDVTNIHLLAESGLPAERTNYTSLTWYSEQIQRTLRQFYIDKPLVKIASSNNSFISITTAKFPELYADEALNDKFYSLSKTFHSLVFPDAETFRDWQRIINQEKDAWRPEVIVTLESLVKEIRADTLQLHFKGNEDQIVEWLNEIIGFIYLTSRNALAENNAIYLDQQDGLKLKQNLRIDPGINEKLKSIGKQLNQPIYEQLLHKGIKHREGISEFNVESFYNDLNIFIGKLEPSLQNKEQYKAIFELTSMFTDSIAKEREKWFQLAHELLPSLAIAKVVVSDMAGFNWGSTEKASIRYVAWLVQESGTITDFSKTYFQENLAEAFKWLNRFIEVLFRNQDYQEFIRKYAVLPMQDGQFRKLETYVFSEPIDEPFEPLFKKLYKDFTDKGDPKRFLIDRAIAYAELPTVTVEIITKPIDELFASHEVETKVDQGKPLNSLFHELNNWLGKSRKDADLLFPHFTRRRPVLYIKAFGPEVSSLVMKLHNLDKSFAEIEALVNLNMTAADLAILKKASLMAGGPQVLLMAAAEIERRAQEAAWRKLVGDAAEKAFTESISELNLFLLDNPDSGYDFEITVPGKELIYYLEVKSTVQGKENIQMSSLQGKTAKSNSGRYSLCVLMRELSDDVVTKDYFVTRSRFLTTVGNLVAPNVDRIEENLSSIRTYRQGDNVTTELESEKYSVFVGKRAWGEGMSFEEFIIELKKYFGIDEKHSTGQEAAIP